MADFDPRQLDQLEDALEGLEQLDDLESLELSPALTERLAEYQSVLALCRDAFPVEEPRADALADVLAEAHAVSRRARVREPERGRWQRFWDRWRGTLVPGVALAGTAVAVLWLLEPEQRMAASDTLLTDESKADDERSKAADDSPSEPASEPAAEEADDDSEAEPDEPKDLVGPAPGAGLPTAEPEPALGKAKAVKPRPRPTNQPTNKAKPSVAPEPAPAPTPMSKDETWTELERANADRRKGDCDRARDRYEQVIAASKDNLAVARAKAGVGLCLEQDRRSNEAAKWFDQARSANAGIDAWIETQRDEQPLPGETKKKSSSKAAADALEDSL